MLLVKITVDFIYTSDIIFTLSLGPWVEVWKSDLDVSSSFSTPPRTQRNPHTDVTHTPPEKPHVPLRTHGQADNENARGQPEPVQPQMPSAADRTCTGILTPAQTHRPQADATATATATATALAHSAVTLLLRALFEHRTVSS